MSVTLKRLYVAWDGVSYVDESAYLIDAQGDVRYVAPYSSLVGGAGITDQMTFTLNNASGRFSPLNTSGALYASIGSGGMYMRPVRFDVSVDNGANYYRVFTGVLKLPGAQSPTWQESSTVNFDARSRDELLLNLRQSTTYDIFTNSVNTQPTEDSIFDAWITDPGNGFVSDDLELDGGFVRIPFAWMDDESTLEECWILAAACGGRFFANHEGVFRYESMSAWQTETRSTTSQQTYTLSSFQRLEYRYDDTDLYNEVTVEASPRIVGGVDVVWQSESAVTVQPGETKVIVAKYDAPAYGVTSLDVAARDAGGNDITSSITVTPTYYAQRASLSVVNSSGLAAHLTKLRILGKPVVGAPDQEATRNSITHGANSAYFSGRIKRNRRVGGNPYVQSLPQAEMLAQRILDLSEYPRLQFTLFGCDGVPDRRLGDRVTIDHTAVAGFMSSAVACYVTGIRWSYNEMGFTQDMEVVQASNLFVYDNNYFIVGTHTANGTRRLFY